MVRGTFANIRLQNHCVQNLTGGYTTHWPSGEILPIFEAAKRYRDKATPLWYLQAKNMAQVHRVIGLQRNNDVRRKGSYCRKF